MLLPKGWNICFFPNQVGLRLVEDFRQKVRDVITVNPILPVAQHYEQQLATIKSGLDGADREDFISQCPSLQSMYRIMYQ